MEATLAQFHTSSVTFLKHFLGFSPAPFKVPTSHLIHISSLPLPDPTLGKMPLAHEGGGGWAFCSSDTTPLSSADVGLVLVQED